MWIMFNNSKEIFNKIHSQHGNMENCNSWLDPSIGDQPCFAGDFISYFKYHGLKITLKLEGNFEEYFEVSIEGRIEE